MFGPPFVGAHTRHMLRRHVDESLGPHLFCTSCMDEFTADHLEPLYHCAHHAHVGVFVCQKCTIAHLERLPADPVCKLCVDNMKAGKIPCIQVTRNQPFTPYEIPEGIFLQEKQFQAFLAYWRKELRLSNISDEQGMELLGGDRLFLWKRHDQEVEIPTQYVKFTGKEQLRPSLHEYLRGNETKPIDEGSVPKPTPVIEEAPIAKESDDCAHSRESRSDDEKSDDEKPDYGGPDDDMLGDKSDNEGDNDMEVDSAEHKKDTSEDDSIKKDTGSKPPKPKKPDMLAFHDIADYNLDWAEYEKDLKIWEQENSRESLSLAPQMKTQKILLMIKNPKLN